MKILYITNSILPSSNANTIHVMKMANALSEEGHKVTLVASKGGDIDVNDLYKHYNTSSKFEIVLAKNIRKFAWLFRIGSSISRLRNNDLVYTRWPLAALILSKLSYKKIMLEYHSNPSSLFQRIILRLNIRSKSVYKFIFITHSLRDYFCEKYPEIDNKITQVLPDGADKADLSNSKTSINDGNISCCYVGSFLPGKGVDTIVKIAERMPHIVFHIVGGNADLIKKLDPINHSNIVWYGHLKVKEAMKILCNSEVALLPNKKNVYIDGSKDIGSWTSPLKLFEYMSYGKAIIASNIPVLREILNNSNSVLVDAENVDEWINAIEILNADSELIKKISNQAKFDLESQYTWLIRARRLLNKDVVESTKGIDVNGSNLTK